MGLGLVGTGLGFGGKGLGFVVTGLGLAEKGLGLGETGLVLEGGQGLGLEGRGLVVELGEVLRVGGIASVQMTQLLFVLIQYSTGRHTSLIVCDSIETDDAPTRVVIQPKVSVEL